LTCDRAQRRKSGDDLRYFVNQKLDHHINDPEWDGEPIEPEPKPEPKPKPKAKARAAAKKRSS